MPVHARPLDRDPRRRLRRRRVREPVPVLQRPQPTATTTGPRRCTRCAGRVGRCEVVCFTADHDSSFAQLTPARVRTVLDALGRPHRRAVGAIAEVEQVFCFENRGAEIGVTLHHPHGQIYAYPFVTPRTRAHARPRPAGTANAPAATSSPTCSPPSAPPAPGSWPRTSTGPRSSRPPPAGRSRSSSPRTAACPTCPRSARTRRDAFGPLYLDVLRRFDGLFGVPMPYIAAWHQAPVRVGRDSRHLTCSCSRSGGRRQAQVPRRVGVGHGRLRQRRAARAGRRDAAGGGAVTAAKRVHQTFADAYGRPPETVWAAPGRVNLIGEHTDYNDGFVLPFALSQRTAVAVAPPSSSGTARWTVRSEARPTPVTFDIDDLRPGAVTGGRPTSPASSLCYATKASPCRRPTSRSAPTCRSARACPRPPRWSAPPSPRWSTSPAPAVPTVAIGHGWLSGPRTSTSACPAASWTSPRRPSAERVTPSSSTAAT